MEFRYSQICTNIEQSKRLLALGLKKETADMHHYQYVEGGRWNIGAHPSIAGYTNRLVPAWSLHRLIEMCNNTQFGMTIGIYRDEVTVDGDLFEVYDNTYDNLISIIEWLIGLDKFNENYLDIH